MLGFGFILKAVLAVSIMLAALALVGAPDWLAEQEASMPMKPEPALDAAKTEAPAAPSPAVTTPEPVVETAPAPFTPPPEISLAQATVVPEASSASAVLKNDLPPPAEEPETAVPDTPPPPQQEMIRLAATAPQIPAPSLAHIPALVIKFAPAKVLFGAVNAPSKMATRSIGFYAKGCLAGAKAFARQRPGLAGHAPFQKSHVGASDARALH